MSGRLTYLIGKTPMTTFDLALPRQVLFGPGRAAELTGLLLGLGHRVLLCTGRDPSRHRHLLGGTEPVAVVPVGHEPTVDDVRTATERARAAEADVVVAIGGGSVLDLGKAVAVLLGNGTDPVDHLEVVGRGIPVERPSVPYVAVPTTAGTGAEATANATLRSPEHGIKASIRSPHMLAAVALVDPLLTVTCPPAVTASSGLDALTQCLEPYVSPRANPATDAVAAEGLRRGARALRRAYEHGDDRDARADMALCSLFGGIALANAKLGAVHGLAGVIGGMVDAPHGAVCAALLAPVAEANVRALYEQDAESPALRRYAAVARQLTGRDDAAIEDAVTWLRETVAALHVPPLGAVGLQPAQYAEVAGKAARSSSMQGNPVRLSVEQLVAVLTKSS
jgi:alcohol dehydrogenase class IV